jgi:hypothetical protein
MKANAVCAGSILLIGFRRTFAVILIVLHGGLTFVM